MRRGGAGRWVLRGIATVATVLTSLALILGVGIYVLATTGIGTDRLGNEAETAIRSLSGLDVDATFGRARVSIDASQLLAVSVPDVSLTAKQDGAPLLKAGSIDFGVRPLPLFSGDVQMGSARVSDAKIFTSAFASGESSDWSAVLRNTDGLIDPDLLAPVVFDAVHRLFGAFGAGSTHSVELDNVEFVLPSGSAVDKLSIDNAALARNGDDGLRFSASLLIDGRTVTIEGSAARDAEAKTIAALALDVDLSAPDDAEGADASKVVSDKLGSAALKVTGEEGQADKPSKLVFSAAVGPSTFAIDAFDYLEGELDITASITTGENKLRVEKLAIRQDRSSYVFYGPVGPRPVSAGQPPAYRFELASDSSTSAPSGSTEPALEFSAMLAGAIDPLARRLDVPSLEIRTSSGTVQAKAAVAFVEGGPPGVDLDVRVPELSVSHLKQLWPFTAAGNARRWAIGNLFGGRVTNGHVQYKVVPGRIGNGVPLSGDEVSGGLEIAGSRFDITGNIPAMRDTVGKIDFRGNDVDVTLTSGAVYLPDGEKVAASNGVFTIRDAYKDQVVGQLELDIAGQAKAIAELATYEPIDGLRSIGMSPRDFSGEMWGHISTPIPLVGDVDPKTLQWQVSLDFTDLALAKPIEDQAVTDAVGNITLDPLKALIKARARLNGAPATIDVVEPISQAGPKPSRDIAIQLDDKAREAMAPGLGEMVQGPMKVSFISGEGGGRDVKVDLTDAKLDLPWIGWSKGPGIGATAEFEFINGDSTTRLNDFKLSGKSFAIAGDIVLADGGLSSAKLGTVRLNRGDDANVSIKRDGKGFDINVTGSTLDARSLIKLLKAEKTGSEEPGSATRPITVTGKMERLTGFHDEVLSDVTLTYSTSGGSSGSAKFAANTSSGAKVAVKDVTEDGLRALEIQSSDAGAVLRFMDIYEHMAGGTMKFALGGPADGTLTGQVDASNFEIVNESKLQSLVSSSPDGDGRSLNKAVKREIDTSRVKFERGFAQIAKGKGALVLKQGVLRGPSIGSTFQGTLYDSAGNMDMTGTFMPAYGLNRIFGELPLVGIILGNGRDRGLIGVTFKLTGDADEPKLTINPLSVIAPGIFRSIFEFR